MMKGSTMKKMPDLTSILYTISNIDYWWLIDDVLCTILNTKCNEIYSITNSQCAEVKYWYVAICPSQVTWQGVTLQYTDLSGCYRKYNLNQWRNGRYDNDIENKNVIFITDYIQLWQSDKLKIIINKVHNRSVESFNNRRASSIGEVFTRGL